MNEEETNIERLRTGLCYKVIDYCFAHYSTLTYLDSQKSLFNPRMIFYIHIGLSDSPPYADGDSFKPRIHLITKYYMEDINLKILLKAWGNFEVTKDFEIVSQFKIFQDDFQKCEFVNKYRAENDLEENEERKKIEVTAKLLWYPKEDDTSYCKNFVIAKELSLDQLKDKINLDTYRFGIFLYESNKSYDVNDLKLHQQ